MQFQKDYIYTTLDGKKVLAKHHIDPRAPDAPAKMVVTVKYESPWHFTLSPEGYLPKFFKQWGLLKELQLEDDCWDQQVYIEGDEPALKTLLNSEPEFKSLVLRFIQKSWRIKIGFTGFKIDAGSVTATEAKDHFSNLVSEINIIISSLEKAKASGIVPTTKDQSWIFYSFVFTIFIMGLSAIIYGSLVTEEKYINLTGDLGIYGGFAGVLMSIIPLIIWKNVRKLHSRSHFEFTLLFVVGLFSFTLIGSSSMYYFNRVLDTSKGHHISAYFAKKRYRTNKHGNIYFVVFEYNLPAEINSLQRGYTRTLTVDRKAYENANESSFITLTVYEGFFGRPWIRTY